MAGVAGFEPANTGVKAPRLTAWRHPNAGDRTAAEKRKNGKAARIFAGAAIKKNGVGSGIRTHGLQSHNLAR